MKKLLIIKTGSTYPSIEKRFGDFDAFIINQLQVPKTEVVVHTAFENMTMPDLTGVASIIITGSHSMVSDRTPWSEALAEWLSKEVPAAIPVLGICYGHQLLAHAFGGQVGYHPEGSEIGTVQIELTEAGKKDILLGIMPPVFVGHATHAQTVLKLPAGAELLARNAYEPHHAFVINKNRWGVQFHPEFTAEILGAYIDERKEKLKEDGFDVSALHGTLQEHEFGRQLLHRFIKLANQ